MSRCPAWGLHEALNRTDHPGLARLLELLITQALLSDYATEHQGLPPRVAALFYGWQPPGEE